MDWFTRTITRISGDEKSKNISCLSKNFHLIWLDNTIDVINDSYCIDTIAQLQQLVQVVHTFTDVDECIDFITNLNDEQILMILSGSLGEIVISCIHDITQIKFFYIFCRNIEWHRRWASKWDKIEDVITDVKSLYEVIQKTIENFDETSIPISIINTTDNIVEKDLDHLDRSFMYTQILKEILLDIHYEEKDIQDFFIYCREKLIGDDIRMIIDDIKIDEDYHKREPIWWYTCPSFLYSCLNKALRDMDILTIIKMGFFLRDLCQHIAALHFRQYNNSHDHHGLLTVYRGQKLSQKEFEQIKKTPGGLLSFNNFLSTSTKHTVASKFARSNTDKPDLVNILFIIQIDIATSSIPFANVRGVSYYPTEDEILFSMHSIFRIGQINRIDTPIKPLWEIHLTLTNDNDDQLRLLTDCIRRETFTTEKGWYRLGNLLYILGEYTKAEQVCAVLFAQTTDQSEIASIYHLLGMIKYGQGKYKESIEAYKVSIRIKKRIFSPTSLSLASSYTNIGEVYNALGKYTKAFPFHRDALEIKQNNLLPNDPALALSYDNIGSTLHNMSVYSQAMLYYEKALEIRLETLPATHPDLSQSYHNLGSVNYRMRRYSTAILYFERAIKIKQITLPEKHISLASSYKNIGAVYERLEQYSKAHAFYKDAFNISKGASLTNHPSLRTLQKDLNRVKKKCNK